MNLPGMVNVLWLTPFNLQGRLDSQVVFTLNFEHWYAMPWAVRSILDDNYSFLAQA